MPQTIPWLWYLSDPIWILSRACLIALFSGCHGLAGCFNYIMVGLAILECSWPMAMRLFALWQRTWGSSLPTREVRRIRLQVFLAVGAVAVLVGAMMFQTGYLEQQSVGERLLFTNHAISCPEEWYSKFWSIASRRAAGHCDNIFVSKHGAIPRYFAPLSSRVRGLFVKHRTGNPLVDSVAEHQATSPRAYWHLRWTVGSIGSWVITCIYTFFLQWETCRDGVKLIGLWWRS